MVGTEGIHAQNVYFQVDDGHILCCLVGQCEPVFIISDPSFEGAGHFSIIIKATAIYKLGFKVKLLDGTTAKSCRANFLKQ